MKLTRIEQWQTTSIKATDWLGADWAITSVDSSQDIQVLNRQIPINVDDSEEIDEDVNHRTIERYGEESLNSLWMTSCSCVVKFSCTSGGVLHQRSCPIL